MERRAVTLVALGGFAGATTRHAITVVLPATFPWGTLAVNVIGSFLLGLVVYGTRERGPISPRIRLIVSTGFISSFTTYSTFAAETVGLDPVLATLNVVANYAFGFLAVLSALVVIRWRS